MDHLDAMTVAHVERANVINGGNHMLMLSSATVNALISDAIVHVIKVMFMDGYAVVRCNQMMSMSSVINGYAICILHRQHKIFVHVAKQPLQPSHDGQHSQFNLGIVQSSQHPAHNELHEHDGHLQSSQQ